MSIIYSIFITGGFRIFQTKNMTVIVKTIVAAALSGATILGCLALFIYAT